MKRKKAIAPKRVNKKIHGSLMSNVWPMERDFLERPDRYKYVRKLIKTDGCVFCSALKEGLTPESLVLYQNKHAMVMLNKYPYNTGHVLVLPRRHCGRIMDLKQDEYMGMAELLKVSTEILDKEYKCKGMNIGMNHGEVAGAGIPDHLHWHIVPRWWGDTNFFPLIAETKVLPETLAQTYSRLKPYYETLK